MKVKASVKPICEKCKVVKRKGKVTNKFKDNFRRCIKWHV